MHKKTTIISPADNSIVAERNFATNKECEQIIKTSFVAQKRWKETQINERKILCHKAIDYFVNNSAAFSKEITTQMGRPIRYTPSEIKGLEERARYMIDIASQSLTTIKVDEENNKNCSRYIKREPLGIVFTIAPWNYPYLTAINSIIPALMAGNSVLLKHSKQTLLCAERLHEAFNYAGLPNGVFQYLHIDHEQCTTILKNPKINFISFTGSYEAGMSIEKSIAGYNKGLALELGGKDPAYVMPDADLPYAIENLVEGAYFNSGQSCCAVERIYVHEHCYQDFIAGFVEQVNQYKLGNPLENDTTLGPMVNAHAANKVREQVTHALSNGAKSCVDQSLFSYNQNQAYLPPEVLINVDHNMSIMQEESFGPVVGIMKVKNDEEALELMNDSRFGLTASIWTADIKNAEDLGAALNTGTVFMNRCDYLDPALAWTGVKNSGRGCSLSSLGYHQLTRAKSFNLRQLSDN